MTDPDPLPAFAARLKALRKSQGLSQEELAHRAGVYFTDVSRYERQVREPGLRALVKLADGLGVTVNDLLGE